jgi:hypothetical protein
MTERLERCHRQPHGVDRAEPGVGHQHHPIRVEDPHQVDGIPIAADR